MSWTARQKYLAILLVLTGSINTLITKWANMLSSPGSDGQERLFQHPFLQASMMFLGEIFCLVIYELKYRKTVQVDFSIGFIPPAFNPWILFVPAFFDLVATSLMYIGLTLTFASSFQMLRGSVIIFTAILSTTFLKKMIFRSEWIGIIIITSGLIIVGVADFVQENLSDNKNSITTGNFLIVIAQIISAAQMVYEENYVSDLNIHPLRAVGWEGVFGFVMLLFLQFGFYFIPAPEPFGNNSRHTVEDSIEGLVQIYNNPMLQISAIGAIVSIAFFNFAGISVTKELSATTRMILDSVRTIFIWMLSLALHWQMFYWPSLIGFIVMVIGMCIYNNILLKNVSKKFHFRQSLPPAEPVSIYNVLEEEA